MVRTRSYYFIIDNFTPQGAELLRRGLLELSAVIDVKANTRSGLIEVIATKRIESDVEKACKLAGLNLRTQVKRSEL